jgi:hypothetical protein
MSGFKKKCALLQERIDNPDRMERCHRR